MGIQIAIVHLDNREGLYVNEKLVAEHREISISKLMQYVLYQHVDRFQQFFADDYNFRENLQDVLLRDGRTIRETQESE